MRSLAGGRSRRERARRAQPFYVGLTVLAVAVSPPLDRLADEFFWWHMVQHALLQMVAPPLIVLGAPWLALWRPVSVGGRRRASRWLIQAQTAAPLRAASRLITAPVAAWVLFVGVIWLSHMPVVFDYAATHPAIHEFEHFLFFALGLLFWSRAFDSPPFHARVTHWHRLAFFGSAAAAEAILGLLILAVHKPLYAPYEGLVTRPEHLPVMADQQLGGAIMFEPASLPLLFAIFWSIGMLRAPRVRRIRSTTA
jgi:cytochrome c oxidase assembly factor CtaG